MTRQYYNDKMLTSILSNAVAESPYYRDIVENGRNNGVRYTLSQFPILTRDIVAKERERILISDYTNTLLKECTIHLTSGSSGKQVGVYWHHNDELRSNLSLWRLRNKFYGISPADKCCTLHTTRYSWYRTTGMQKIVYEKKRLSFSKLFLSDSDIHNYYNEIINFEPVWLLFQPSILCKFADFIIENRLPVPRTLRYIEFTGEQLTSRATDIAKNIFGCAYANTYGTTETNAIAFMCPEGKMHILEDNVFLEVAKNVPEANIGGDLIVTSLTNKVFPLIRYTIGDVVTLSDNLECACGITGIQLETLSGRVQNHISLSTGTVIHENMIVSIVDMANSNSGFSILEFKAFINCKKGLVNFVLFSRATSAEQRRVITRNFEIVISRYFSDMFKYTITFIDKAFRVSEAGKYSVMELIK